jgi:methylated-DNA-protein-cysteine methyltransferase-like protein
MKKHYYEQVYEVVKEIPFGRVCTYGIIADYLSLGSARMVGYALNKCDSLGKEVPAHRVVNRIGYLSGRNAFDAPGMMEALLNAEGVKVKKDAVVDFKKLLWYPEEL